MHNDTDRIISSSMSRGGNGSFLIHLSCSRFESIVCHCKISLSQCALVGMIYLSGLPVSRAARSLQVADANALSLLHLIFNRYKFDIYTNNALYIRKLNHSSLDVIIYYLTWKYNSRRKRITLRRPMIIDIYSRYIM